LNWAPDLQRLPQVSAEQRGAEPGAGRETRIECWSLNIKEGDEHLD